MNCILCEASAKPFATDYFHCFCCDLRFLDPARRLLPDEEFARYRTHENDLNDPRYVQFMKPMMDRARRLPKSSRVLDFGCGSQAVLKHVLEPEGYMVENYDAFFFPDEAVLESTFDFIAAIEVLEHIYEPARALTRLRKCLAPSGRLGLMTVMYQPGQDFENWYYRRDPTHVAFYSTQTFAYIRVHFGFQRLEILSDRQVELS